MQSSAESRSRELKKSQSTNVLCANQEARSKWNSSQFMRSTELLVAITTPSPYDKFRSTATIPEMRKCHRGSPLPSFGTPLKSRFLKEEPVGARSLGIASVATKVGSLHRLRSCVFVINNSEYAKIPTSVDSGNSSCRNLDPFSEIGGNVEVLALEEVSVGLVEGSAVFHGLAATETEFFLLGFVGGIRRSGGGNG